MFNWNWKNLHLEMQLLITLGNAAKSDRLQNLQWLIQTQRWLVMGFFEVLDTIFGTFIPEYKILQSYGIFGIFLFPYTMESVW